MLYVNFYLLFQDSVHCTPWTAKSPKMAQPDLDYTAPEIQLDKCCTPFSDIFSLGMLTCAIYNTGHSLIEADHNTSNYAKRVDQVNRYFPYYNSSQCMFTCMYVCMYICTYTGICVQRRHLIPALNAWAARI